MTETKSAGTNRAKRIVAFILVLVFFGATLYALSQHGWSESTFEDKNSKYVLGVGSSWKILGAMIAAGLTLAFYSFLYEDNPLFKAAEHLYVGVGLGYMIVQAYFQNLKGELYAPLFKHWIRDDVPGTPHYILIVPIIMGMFLLARFIKPIAWLSRWSFAFIVGFGSGIAIPTYVKANILAQIFATIQPLSRADPLGSFNTIVIAVGVISVLVYFYFSVEHKGVIGGISKVGIWFLMVCFGASFGYTVMGRMALFVDRARFLLNDWLQLGVGG